MLLNPELLSIIPTAKIEEKIATGFKELDDVLGGGLPIGAISEWGMPPGQFGRHLLVRFISRIFHSMNSRQFGLWVFSAQDINVYPPSWLAHGVDLNFLCFVRSQRPVTDLKPIFANRHTMSEPLFPLIVLDAPQKLVSGDLVFLAASIRKTKQSVWLLRNYLLSSKRGNVWAKIRCNCLFDDAERALTLHFIRGGKPKKIAVRLEEFSHA